MLADGSLVRGTDRRVLWLSTAGFFSAAGRADDDFFGWYVNQGRQDGQSIALNPRIVTEFVLEFCRFVHFELKPRWEGPWHLLIRDNYFCRVATISFAGFGRPDGA